MSKALFCTLGIFKIPAAADWVYKRGNTATCDGILHWPDSWSKIWFKSALWAHQKHSKGSQSVFKHWAEQCAASTGKIQTCWMRQSKTKKHLNTSIPCPVVSVNWGAGINSSPAVLLWIQLLTVLRALGTSPVPHLRGSAVHRHPAPAHFVLPLLLRPSVAPQATH